MKIQAFTILMIPTNSLYISRYLPHEHHWVAFTIPRNVSAPRTILRTKRSDRFAFAVPADRQGFWLLTPLRNPLLVQWHLERFGFTQVQIVTN